MCALRLASYNVEWFNTLFDDAGRLLMDDGPSARYHISRRQQLTALGAAFAALNADGVMIIEAPDNSGARSTVTALEGFAQHFNLRARTAVVGYTSDTEQEIAFLYDPDVLAAVHDPLGTPAPALGAPGAPRFDSQLRLDIDQDGTNDLVRFSKPPLELAVTLRSGQSLRLIGVHAKSKAAHNRKPDADLIRIAVENRRKQLAECLWLRMRVAGHLRAADKVVVLGDFNDGPGLDEYEQLFDQSGVDVVIGPADAPAMQMFDPHAAQAMVPGIGQAPTTARFWIQPERRFYEALIDFIMVSPNLAATQPVWRIWHPLRDPALVAQPDLQHALLSASDHFPVTIDVVM